jgi:23S rRNA (guanine745-N1)-methyltransferase
MFPLDGSIRKNADLPDLRRNIKNRRKKAFCSKGHSFDRAKEGYLNLLMASGKGGHGDDKAMLLARRDFLERGYYRHLLSALEEEMARVFPANGILVDAGCGEGYYTSAIFDRLYREGKEPSLFAFDIAKDAARLAAKKIGSKGEIFVGSCYRIPLLSESCDAILSVFSPYAEEEFYRILKPNGVLICAVPMPEHLFSLKKAVYDNPLLNEKRACIGERFSLCLEKRVQKRILISEPDAIRALFGMTPYAHKTSREDMAKLDALKELSVETDFGILIYQKRG